MTTTLSLLEAVQALAPQAVERARRLQYAAALLSQRRSRREVSGMVFARYHCTRSKAWRLVNMAADLAAEISPPQSQQQQEPEEATR